MNQTIILNLIPNGIPEVAYVSQCDVGREITCKLYEGTASYSIPSGATLTVNGAKEDRTIFEYGQSDGAISWTSGADTVTITTLQQMTVVSGDVLCQIRVTKDGDDIGILNFIMRVMPKPMLVYGGDAPSTSELPALIALATEQEEHAAASATAAASSAASAAGSATSASNSATSAAGSATSAENSATAAQNSAASAAESAQSAIAWSAHPPYIGANGNWYVWNTTDEQYEDSGIDASITVTIADITMLAPDATPTVTNTGSNTDPIFHLGIPRGKGISSISKTGTSGLVDTYTITYSDGYTSTFTVTNGKSAYQYATEGGYSGTESDFYSELAGVHEYAEDSEAYATGKRGGTDVGSSDPAYHNNAKHYAGEAGSSATAAGTSETNAESSAQDAEAYAVGKRDSVDVPSTDPAYHNNAKYYSEQASAVTVGKNDKITVTADSNALTDASTVLSASTGENPTAMASHAISKFWTYISGKITGAISGLLTTNLTPSKAIVSDANGKVSVSDTTSTELSYLHGVTGDVQTQFDGGTELLKDTVGWSGKNLLPADAVSDTTHGMTFTVNADKSITMSGTPDNDFVGFRVTTGTFSLKRGTYTISGAPDISELGSKANLCVYWNNGQNNAASYFYDTEVEFTVNADYNDAFAVIQVSGLYDYGSSITFYPMIRRADILDPTYEPYHAPVQSISDNIAPTEGATASGAYTAGSYIIWQDGNMYQVTANVSQGTAWAVGTNLEKKSVNDVFCDLAGRGINYKPAFRRAFSEIPKRVGIRCDTVDNPGGVVSDSPYPTKPGCYDVISIIGYYGNRGFQLCTGVHPIVVGYGEIWIRSTSDYGWSPWVKIGPTFDEVSITLDSSTKLTDKTRCNLRYDSNSGLVTGYLKLIASTSNTLIPNTFETIGTVSKAPATYVNLIALAESTDNTTMEQAVITIDAYGVMKCRTSLSNTYVIEAAISYKV